MPLFANLQLIDISLYSYPKSKSQATKKITIILFLLLSDYPMGGESTSRGIELNIEPLVLFSTLLVCSAYYNKMLL